jgi:hypothetical protein
MTPSLPVPALKETTSVLTLTQRAAFWRTSR